MGSPLETASTSTFCGPVQGGWKGDRQCSPTVRMAPQSSAGPCGVGSQTGALLWFSNETRSFTEMLAWILYCSCYGFLYSKWVWGLACSPAFGGTWGEGGVLKRVQSTACLHTPSFPMLLFPSVLSTFRGHATETAKRQS